TYYGYRTFSELLEDAQKEGVLELETDKRSRTYVVTRFGEEMKADTGPAAKTKDKDKMRRRRRTSSGQRTRSGGKTSARTAEHRPERPRRAEPAEENPPAPSPARKADHDIPDELITFPKSSDDQ